MRTTIRLDDRLLADVKELAARTGRTLTAVIEDALREVLARRQQPRKNQRAKLKTHGKGGLLPGVDLADSAALLDLMESENAVD